MADLTDVEIGAWQGRLRNHLKDDVGQYALSTSAPTSGGTWAAAGTAIGAISGYKSGRSGELQAESERDTADVGLKSIEDAIQRLEQSTTKGRAAVMADYGQAVETESFKTGMQKLTNFKISMQLFSIITPLRIPSRIPGAVYS